MVKLVPKTKSCIVSIDLLVSEMQCRGLIWMVVHQRSRSISIKCPHYIRPLANWIVLFHFDQFWCFIFHTSLIHLLLMFFGTIYIYVIYSISAKSNYLYLLAHCVCIYEGTRLNNQTLSDTFIYRWVGCPLLHCFLIQFRQPACCFFFSWGWGLVIEMCWKWKMM